MARQKKTAARKKTMTKRGGAGGNAASRTNANKSPVEDNYRGLPDGAFVEETLARLGFSIGDEIKVDGEGKTVYRIRGVWWDGSIKCSAGDGIRSFRPEWCYLAKTLNSRGKMVESRIPESVKGQRQLWLEKRGFKC